MMGSLQGPIYAAAIGSSKKGDESNLPKEDQEKSGNQDNEIMSSPSTKVKDEGDKKPIDKILFSPSYMATSGKVKNATNKAKIPSDTSTFVQDDTNLNDASELHEVDRIVEVEAEEVVEKEACDENHECDEIEEEIELLPEEIALKNAIKNANDLIQNPPCDMKPSCLSFSSEVEELREENARLKSEVEALELMLARSQEIIGEKQKRGSQIFEEKAKQFDDKVEDIVNKAMVFSKTWAAKGEGLLFGENRSSIKSPKKKEKDTVEDGSTVAAAEDDFEVESAAVSVNTEETTES